MNGIAALNEIALASNHGRPVNPEALKVVEEAMTAFWSSEHSSLDTAFGLKERKLGKDGNYKKSDANRVVRLERRWELYAAVEDARSKGETQNSVYPDFIQRYGNEEGYWKKELAHARRAIDELGLDE